jgi:hypothetical protein
LGSTNRTTLAYCAESTPGVTPANPPFTALRVTSNTPAFTPKTVVSAEIRPDRQTTDLILIDADSGGAVAIETSFRAFDDMIQASLQATWNLNQLIAVVTAGVEISALSTTTATVVTPLGTPFKAGMLVNTGGFANAANNGLLAPVVSSSATTVVFGSATFTVDASPQAGAKLQQCGFQGASADITATATGLASTVLDFTTLGIGAGEWLKIGGDTTGFQFATAALNSWARAIAVSAHAITLDNLPAGWTTDSGTGKTIQIFTGDFLANGTTVRSFTLERQQQDITVPSYEYFPGSQLDKWSLDFKAASILAGSFSFIGTTGSVLITRLSGATDIAAPAFSVLNTSSNVGRMMVGGVAVAGPSFFQEIGFDLANNLAGQKAIGTLGSVGIRNGSLSLSGKINAYFGDTALLAAAIANTQTSIMIKTNRSDLNREGYVFDIPALKITGSAPVPGKDQDRFFSGTYQAFRHSTLGYTVSVGRFPYLPIAN